ncbi:MAG TPA: DUF393 domain-containing protein [Mycobacteriales bacterium]|nr:DUF393 domain-containing protein [Mycobacteriales bacterium]
MTRHREIDATLIYDGDCAFCTRCVQLMERRLPARPRVTPWQWADLPRLGVTQAQAERSVLWVEPGSPPLAGAAAIARLLVQCGGLWLALGRAMQVPPVSWLAAGVYRLIANNRGRLPGGTAACALPQAQRDALRSQGEGPAA